MVVLAALAIGLMPVVGALAAPAAPAPGTAGDAATGRGTAAPLGPGSPKPRLTHEVYGYLPWWKVDAGTDAYLRYDLLTTLAFFSIRYTSTGALDTTTKGYLALTGSHAGPIIEHAHANGVRVEVSVTFSSSPDTNGAFLANQEAMARAIADTVALVGRLGLDGVNIDLERLYNRDFPAYGAFVGAMRQAVVAANPNGRVTVATNGNTSGAGMAKAAIDNGADRAFLMGYSYRTGGANPVGSIAPLVSFNDTLDLTESLDKYAAAGVPAERTILGLPYYGRTWPTVSDALNAKRNMAVTECSFSPSTPTAAQIPGIAAGATIRYDDLEQAAWFARFDSAKNTWCQTYFDDARTLATKYDLAKSRGLAGAGIWALGYDRGLATYWEALADAFDPPGAAFVPLGPTRIVDTRTKLGATTLVAGVPQRIAVAGVAGVPADAVAVTGNLTVVRPTRSGYVSLTPARTTNPATSTLNVPAGDTRANAVTVPLGEGGVLWAVFRAGASSATAGLVFDLTGYFRAGDPAGAAYVPIAPARLVDSRLGQGANALRMGQPQEIAVAGRAGVPAGAVAVTGNLTVVRPTSGGHVSLTPERATEPATSTLNLPAGDTRANAVTVPLGPGGSLWVVYRSRSTSDNAHVVLDITGYFVAGADAAAVTGSGASPALYHAVGPTRFVDTRIPLGATVLRMGQPQAITVAGLAGVPPGAVAVTGNLTVTAPSRSGHVSLTPERVTDPATSTLNLPAGDTRANAVTVRLGTDGRLWVVYRAGSTSASAHVVLDVTGYYLPAD